MVGEWVPGRLPKAGKPTGDVNALIDDCFLKTTRLHAKKDDEVAGCQMQAGLQWGQLPLLTAEHYKTTLAFCIWS